MGKIMNDDRISVPVKRVTRVDFIRTEVKFGERDGEIIVTGTVKIQLDKFDYAGLHDIWARRFPYIRKNGTFTVTGRAVCGNEPFDFEKGKRIAETRMQKKAYATVSKVYKMIAKEFDRATKFFNYYRINCDSCVKSAEEHIVNLDA